MNIKCLKCECDFYNICETFEVKLLKLNFKFCTSNDQQELAYV